jgi:sigma-B regulation protein RsbU (phosphoserine phosphatase)
VVADVSGKGVPAAMLMANLQGLFRSHVAAMGREPERLLATVNRLFHEATPAEAFATAFYGVYDESERELHYLSCGHPAGMLRRAGGRMEELEAGAMVLGAFGFWRGEATRVRLEAGDRLLVVSDGVAEAQRGEEEFGEERLRAWLARTAEEEPAEALEAMEREIVRFSGPSLFDDCTLFLMAI